MPSKTLKEKLLYIQQNLKVAKSQYNKFGRYYYRSCEDILEGIKPLLGNASLIITDQIIQVGDRYYVRATVTLSNDESVNSIQVVAYAREELEKKGMDGSQITGAASSYARKYALNGLFLIDDAKDADAQRKDDKGTDDTSKTYVGEEGKKELEREYTEEKKAPQGEGVAPQGEGVSPDGEGGKKSKTKTYLTFEQLTEKMATAKNVFELNARAKKYRPDYDKFDKERQVAIRIERDKRKVWLERGEGNYTDEATKGINKPKGEQK